MADDWDAEDFEPQIAYQRPEELEAQEAAKNELLEAESKDKESKKQAKVKPMKYKPKDGSHEPERELTAKEREELQRKTDLGLAKDLFGGDGDEEDTIPYSELKTSLEFTEFAENLSTKLATRQKADLYPAFIQHLMYKLCTDLDSKNVRKLSSELKALADLKANEDKSKKTSSKPTIKTSQKGAKPGGGAKLYDDFLDGSGTGAADYGRDDDDDFM